MNICDDNPSNWNIVWSVDANGEFTNGIIVDDAIILTDEGSILNVIDINNGKLLWEYKFNRKLTYDDTEIIPGIDVNGNPVLITQVCTAQGDPEQHAIFAFQ